MLKSIILIADMLLYLVCFQCALISIHLGRTVLFVIQHFGIVSDLLYFFLKCYFWLKKLNVKMSFCIHVVLMFCTNVSSIKNSNGHTCVNCVLITHDIIDTLYSCWSKWELQLNYISEYVFYKPLICQEQQALWYKEEAQGHKGYFYLERVKETGEMLIFIFRCWILGTSITQWGHLQKI